MGNPFVGILTTAGISNVLNASSGGGTLNVTSYAVSATAGSLDPSRTVGNATWYSSAFLSEVTIVDDVITVPIVIPADVDADGSDIAEIYLYANLDGGETTLFAIVHPPDSTPIAYSNISNYRINIEIQFQGVNTTGIFNFVYSADEDVSAHNVDVNAHQQRWVLKAGDVMTGALHLTNPVSLTSSGGVLTLSESSNSFIASGSEAITSIAGWTSGIAHIRWNTIRTLTNSASLVLIGGANRATTIGDTGIYEFTVTGARELAYFNAAGTPIATVPIAKGGTNITSYTTGDLLYCSATNVLSKLAKGNSGQYLVMGATVPAWSTLDLSTKADLAGSSSQQFSAAEGTDPNHVATISQLNDPCYVTYAVNGGLTSVNKVSDAEVSFTGNPTVTFPNGKTYKNLVLNNIENINENGTFVNVMEEDDISNNAVTQKAVNLAIAGQNLLMDFSSSLTSDKYGNTITTHGNPTLSNGKYVGDGTGDGLTATTITSFSTGHWIIEGRFKFDTNNTLYHLFNAKTSNILSVQRTAANKIALKLGQGSSFNIADALSSKNDFDTSSEYHIALVFDGSSYKVYINGTLDANLSISSSTVIGASGLGAIGAGLCIGINNDQSSNSLDGTMDDLRVTVGTARYTANFTPSAVGSLVVDRFKITEAYSGSATVTYTSDLTTTGNAISDSNNQNCAASDAFDDNMSEGWMDGVTTGGWIGQSGLTQKVRLISFYQPGYAYDYPAGKLYAEEIVVEYSANGSNWTTLKTVTGLAYDMWNYIYLDDYSAAGTYYLRLRQLDVSDRKWTVTECQMFAIASTSSTSLFANITYTADLTSTGNAIANSQQSPNVAGNAFNDTTASFWYGNVDQSLSGVEYIGQSGLTTNVKRIKIYNYTNTVDGYIYCPASVKVQYSTDGNTWNDIITCSLSTANGLTTTLEIPDYGANGTHSVRLLANANLAPHDQYTANWIVAEVEMYGITTDYGNDGDYWLDYSTVPMTPYKKISGSWIEKQFVKTSEEVKVGNVMGIPYVYCFNRFYDSGEFDVNTTTRTYTKTHKLGYSPEHIILSGYVMSNNKYRNINNVYGDDNVNTIYGDVVYQESGTATIVVGGTSIHPHGGAYVNVPEYATSGKARIFGKTIF